MRSFDNSVIDYALKNIAITSEVLEFLISSSCPLKKFKEIALQFNDKDYLKEEFGYKLLNLAIERSSTFALDYATFLIDEIGISVDPLNVKTAIQYSNIAVLQLLIEICDSTFYSFSENWEFTDCFYNSRKSRHALDFAIQQASPLSIIETLLKVEYEEPIHWNYFITCACINVHPEALRLLLEKCPREETLVEMKKTCPWNRISKRYAHDDKEDDKAIVTCFKHFFNFFGEKEFLKLVLESDTLFTLNSKVAISFLFEKLDTSVLTKTCKHQQNYNSNGKALFQIIDPNVLLDLIFSGKIDINMTAENGVKLAHRYELYSTLMYKYEDKVDLFLKLIMDKYNNVEEQAVNSKSNIFHVFFNYTRPISLQTLEMLLLNEKCKRALQQEDNNGNMPIINVLLGNRATAKETIAIIDRFIPNFLFTPNQFGCIAKRLFNDRSLIAQLYTADPEMQKKVREHLHMPLICYLVYKGDFGFIYDDAYLELFKDEINEVALIEGKEHTALSWYINSTPLNNRYISNIVAKSYHNGLRFPPSCNVVELFAKTQNWEIMFNIGVSYSKKDVIQALRMYPKVYKQTEEVEKVFENVSKNDKTWFQVIIEEKFLADLLINAPYVIDSLLQQCAKNATTEKKQVFEALASEVDSNGNNCLHLLVEKGKNGPTVVKALESLVSAYSATQVLNLMNTKNSAGETVFEHGKKTRTANFMQQVNAVFNADEKKKKAKKKQKDDDDDDEMEDEDF